MRQVTSRAVEAESSSTAPPGHVPAAVRAQNVWPTRTSRGWRYALLRRFLAIADLATALLATAALASVAGAEGLAWALLYLPVWILAAKVLGLYDRDQRSLRHLTVDEVPQLALWALIGVSGLSVVLGLSPAGRPPVSGLALAVVVATLSSVVLRGVVRFLWRTVLPPERVGLVGSTWARDALKRKIELFPDLRMTIVEEHASLDERDGDHTWLAGVERLVYGPRSFDDVHFRWVLERSREAGVLLNVIPPSPGVLGSAAQLSHVAELPLLSYMTGDLSRSTLLLKRALDVLVSSLLLLLLTPVFLVIAAAIKLDSRGPVLFSQWRAGQSGRPFRIHKFRTMVANAEELLPEVVKLDQLPEPVFKLRRDPRVTRVGRGLRRWSLDELPQLVNVFLGEMSLVGPRPEQIEVVDRYSSEQRDRLIVKPGLTGPMQVYGRGALTLDERLALERDYIESLSLGRDLRLLAMTVAAVFRRNGAF